MVCIFLLINYINIFNHPVIMLIKFDFIKDTGVTNVIDCINNTYFWNIDNTSIIDIELNFSSCYNINPNSLAVVVAFIWHLKHKGITNNIKILPSPHSDVMDYSSRINFFKNIGYNYLELFNRKENNGRFVEITNFDKQTSNDVCNKTVQVISKLEIPKEVLEALNFSLLELMDNVLNHSACPFGGFISSQYFMRKDKVIIAIVDSGIGIKEGLKLHPLGLYNDLTNEEALKLSIIKGVTNGKGLGNGLFLASEIIKYNQGSLLIYSGNNCIFVTKQGTKVYQSSYWKGTVIQLTFNRSLVADYKNIFSLNNLPESLEDSLGMSLNPNITDLW